MSPIGPDQSLSTTGLLAEKVMSSEDKYRSDERKELHQLFLFFFFFFL